MNCSEVIRERRSIRKYKENVTIPQEDFERMLEAAMMAPSACNTRPWQFFVVINREMIAKLREAHPFTKMLSTASAAIVVCGRPDLQWRASAKNSGLRTAAPPLKIFSFRQKTWDMEPAGADVIHLWTG
ncbi:MAG: nitroreductase family protein [Sellimonas intestinalis]